MNDISIGTGTVPAASLAADVLTAAVQAPVSCPGAVLLAGDLRRRALRSRRGPLRLDCDGRGGGWAHPAVVTTTRAQQAGLGVAGVDQATARVARTVMDSWSGVTGARVVLLASPRSFCAGVERAIGVVEQVLEQRGGPVRKQIVHNSHVVAGLRQRGAVFVDELDEVPAGSTVVYSAHGVSPAVHAEADRRGLEVIDATCALVTKVHARARRLAARCDAMILIGHAGREEAEGTRETMHFTLPTPLRRRP